MKQLTRRQAIKILGGVMGSAALFSEGHLSGGTGPHPVRVKKTGEFVEIGNGLISARFRKVSSGIEQTYSARRADGRWQPIVKSLQAQNPRPPGASPLYSDGGVDREHRILTAETLNTIRVVKKAHGAVALVLSGATGICSIEKSVQLEPGTDHFHVEVRARLTEKPPRLEYLLTAFVFEGGASPDFTHVPCLKRAQDDIIADRVFDSPAVIIQKGSLLCALAPDLDLLNREVVYAEGARSAQGSRPARIPEDPTKISMPAILDLDLKSGLTADPAFCVGLADYIVEQHVFWRHENRDGLMVRLLSNAQLCYGFDLFLEANAEPYRGYQRISRYLWERYGSRYYRQSGPQVMPLVEYAKVCFPAAFAYTGDTPRDSKRYMDALPYDPLLPGPLPSWLEFEIDGRPVGGIRATPSQWYNDIQFTGWWNGVHDAVGMYWWGGRTDPALVNKARRIVGLALEAPQKEGIFPSVYRYNERRWIGCYWKFSDNFNADWAFPEKWDPAAFPDSWDVNSDFYQTAAASKTAAHLLRYQRMCENNPRILPYVSSYGAFLAGHLDPQGLIPSWFTVDLAPVRELRFNAEGGVHIWFLCELYKATGQNEYLKTAERMAAFLMREILPSQRWYDFETFYSCSKKPENFYDSRTGQWPQCSLSMIWAIEGLAALFECTKNRSYLSAGEAVADYASFYQACWQPHFVTTAYAFGGYRSQNSDAEWLDMRHACAAEALLHLAALTHRQDLYERGAAAMRASFAIINHPRLIKNNIFCYPRYPLGIEPENIDHEGVPQDPLRSGFDWGEGGGLAAAAELLGTLGGAYIDLENNIAVGIDGVIVEHYQVRKNRIEVRLKNQLAALSFPYDASYEIDLTVAGLKAGQYQLVVDGGKPQIIKGPAPLRIPVRVLASSRTN